MPSLSNAAQVQVLSYYFQGVQLPVLSSVYLALHNANPQGGTQATNETAYSGYSRLAIAASPGTFLVSSGPPARAQNIQALQFAACNGSTGDTLNFWSVGTVLSGTGTLITSGVIGNGQIFGFSAYAGSPCQMFVPALPYTPLVNSQVMLQQLGPGCLLPTGLVDGIPYYIGTANIVTGVITLSSTPNNTTPLAATGGGAGYVLPIVPIVVAQGVIPTFPVNSLLTFMD